MKKLVSLIAVLALAACAQPVIEDTASGTIGPIGAVTVEVAEGANIRWGAQDRVYAQKFAGSWSVAKPLPSYEEITSSPEAQAFVNEQVVASVSRYAGDIGGAANGAPATLSITSYVISSGSEQGFVGRDHTATYVLSTATGSVSGAVEVDEVVGAVGLLVRSVAAPADERLSRGIASDASARTGG